MRMHLHAHIYIYTWSGYETCACEKLFATLHNYISLSVVADIRSNAAILYGTCQHRSIACTIPCEQMVVKHISNIWANGGSFPENSRHLPAVLPQHWMPSAFQLHVTLVSYLCACSAHPPRSSTHLTCMCPRALGPPELCALFSEDVCVRLSLRPRPLWLLRDTVDMG